MDAGAGAVAGGDDALAAGSLDLAAVDSAGFDSEEDSDEESEPFEA